MSPELRHGAALSAALHIVVGVVLFVVIVPSLPPEAPQQFAVTMEFAPAASGPAAKPSHEKPAAMPAPAVVAPAKHLKPPKPAVRTPAPPPPPPPPARVASVHTPTPPKPTPPPPVAPKPRPVPTLAKPVPAKAAPVPAPHPKPLLLPKPPPPAPPAPKSATHQPHVIKTPAPASHTLENTLEKLRALEAKKTRAAQATPQSASASATAAADSPESGDTKTLNASERGRIGAHVRRCWTYDAGAKGASHFQVLLDVVTDASGTVRIAKVAPADQGRVDANPALRAFADRAVNAILDPRCATLPLPPALLGASRRLVFRFTP